MERHSGISVPGDGMGSGRAGESREDDGSRNLERIRRNRTAGFYDTHVVVLETARRMLRDPEVRHFLTSP